VITSFPKQSLKPANHSIIRSLNEWNTTQGANDMVSTQLTLNSIPNTDAQAYSRHVSVNSKLKRAVDVVGALVGLAITSALFIPLAIAVQLDNPGPVLYSQLRCGVQGRTFRIWKFRSMVQNADGLKQALQDQNQASGHIFKIKDDPRITRVGKLLRKTSLDEFPQFWNVLMGDMSLVGTRPPSLDEVAKYDRSHWERLTVKPGITGEWQANGRSSVSDFEDIVKMDLDYQAKWSVLYDLQLIFKTVWVVFNKKGAC
jgi:lipopolysaccharide/colanic/teichoic acid biosynthesis glycosyltransferase